MQDVFFFLVTGSTVWVGFDAHALDMKRGRIGGGGLDMSVAAWVVCCVLLWIVAFPCYLVARGRYLELRSAQPEPIGPGVASAAVPPPPTAPPQLSPDGHWWWDGWQWAPVASAQS